MRPEKTLITIALTLVLMTTPLALGTADKAPRATPAAPEDAGALPHVPFVVSGLEGDARLTAVVHALDTWQMQARSEPLADLDVPRFPDAATAAAELAARTDQTLAPDVALALQALTPGLSAPLAEVLAAFLVLQDEADTAFAHPDVAGIRTGPTAGHGEVRLSGVVAAQAALLDAVLVLRHALAEENVRPGIPLILPGIFHLDLTASCSDDVYTEDVPLLIDDCGDDQYLNNAGGGGMWAIGTPSQNLAAALVDYDGADLYAGDRPAATNGGGFGGAGFLYDAAGDDTYHAPKVNDGVNGGGSVGSGFLVDEGGNDHYSAGGWGTNGGGYIGGRGLLVDMGGDDTYAGTHEAVNGGGASGNGGLWDDGGDDSYTAWSFGVNGGGIAGAGLLYDRSGRDTYADDSGGSGVDTTVVPKETNGAQIDDA